MIGKNYYSTMGIMTFVPKLENLMNRLNFYIVKYNFRDGSNNVGDLQRHLDRVLHHSSRVGSGSIRCGLLQNSHFEEILVEVRFLLYCHVIHSSNSKISTHFTICIFWVRDRANNIKVRERMIFSDYFRANVFLLDSKFQILLPVPVLLLRLSVSVRRSVQRSSTLDIGIVYHGIIIFLLLSFKFYF